MRERKEKRLTPQRVLLAGTVTATSVILGIACKDSGEHKPSTEQIEPTQITEQIERPSSNEASTQTVKNLFNQTQELNENYFNQRKQLVSQDDLRKTAINLTISKVRAMLASSQFSDNAFIKNNGHVLIFSNGREFDLDEPTEFVIGTALVDYFFHDTFQDVLKDDIGFVFEKQRLQSYEGFNNIFWLVDNIQIEIGDIPPIARTESLERLAQGLKFLKETGMTLPKKAKIDYFGLEDKNIYENVEGDTLLLQVYSFSNGDFRTETSLTDYIIARNPDVLKNYQEKVSAAFSEQTSEITEPELISSSEYGYLYDDEGELPQVLADYIYDGVSFRKKIAYAATTGHIAETNILQAKYDYAREVFGAFETSVDGRKKNVIDYNLGDVIRMADYNIARPGIYLRETPTLEIDPNRPAIYNYSVVKIIQGPELYLDDINLEATRMWKIQTGNIVGGRIFIGDNERSGWVSEEWFGEQIQSKNTP